MSDTSLTQELLDLLKANIGGEDGPEYLREHAANEYLWYEVEEVSREFIGERRWSNEYKIVYKIKPENRFVCVVYSQSEDYSEIYETYEVAQTEETIVRIKYVPIDTK